MQQANTDLVIRNPFGTMDVPAPSDSEVMNYAASAALAGDAADVNAAPWASIAAASDPLEGIWASRWNGGADPTIAGDTPDKWKEGRAEVRVAGERIYLRFDWDHGRRHGLIDATRDETGRLVGKYINLTNPAIMRPWVGRVVEAARIDGCFPNGRLDFRRYTLLSFRDAHSAGPGIHRASVTVERWIPGSRLSARPGMTRRE